jgi:hypothetical protein|uniref:Uncharacterized protein n=1 Tax=Rhodopseudomonas palustris (strain BisA53) TaxID=316055 RepID=Q07TI7_RHOP5
MQTLVGIFIGALLTVGGVYLYDSMTTSTVAGGEVAASNRTIVNWDVASSEWQSIKTRAEKNWDKLSSSDSAK